VAFGLGAALLQAQQAGQREQLTRQLQQMQERFDREQREWREALEKLVRAQQVQLDALKQQLDALKTNVAPAVPPPTPAATNEPAGAATLAAPPSAATPRWSPAQPLRLGNARNYLDLSFDGLIAAGTSTAHDIGASLELGGHDPQQRGFTVQSLETVLAGNVDPYFRAQANLVFQINPEGDTTVEVEEACVESLALPWNLQAKAGQFFAEYGRLNPTHPHAWDFADQPLVNGRLLGQDGLRSAGARLSWLAPTPFYSELFLAVMNSQGETAHSFRSDHGGEPFLGRLNTDQGVASLGDLLCAPRYAASINLTDAQTLVAGLSAAFGPNSSGRDTATQIYGADLFWKWKSPRQHAGFPFVSWQTEAMLRRYAAGAFNWDLNGNGVADPGELTNRATGQPAVLPRETITDYGLYSQVAWGIRQGWVAALRGDYVFPAKPGAYEAVIGSDLDRASRWRLSPNLTYFPSEFAKIRLQYNYDRRQGLGVDHSVWLQFEFLLGTHAAHRF
jgi:hypothetical protein